MKKVWNLIKEKKFKYISFFWTVISIQFVIGCNLQTKGYSISNFLDFLINLAKIIILSVMFVILHYCIAEVIKRCKKRINILKNKSEEKNNIKKNKCGIYFLIIIICWIPTLLAFYPSILNYDGPTQIYMYMNNKITHHTIISTLLMGFCYKIGVIINNTKIGMLIYSIIQMSIMAGIFAYSVNFIEKKTNKKWIRNISIIFYAIFPFNQLFPLMTTKDTLFAGFVLMFIINIYKIIEEKNTIADYIYIVILSVLMLLFRKNAIYALVVLIPFTIVVFFKNKEILKKLVIVLLIILLSYKGVNKLLLCLDTKGGTGDGYGTIMTSQAIARICKEKNNELTEEEMEQIKYYVKDFERIKIRYNASLADYAKGLINSTNIQKNKMEFIKFIINLALKYPGTFIDAYLDTIRGYWYISDESFNTIYTDGSRGCLELTFSQVFKNENIAIHQNSVIPKLKSFYEDMLAKNYYTKIPVLYIIFQPATYFYILLACVLYSMYKKEKTNLIAEGYLMLYFLTCFLAPCAIIRYIYCVIVSLPVIVSIVVSGILENEKEKGMK